jgi:hypothetical protein
MEREREGERELTMTVNKLETNNNSNGIKALATAPSDTLVQTKSNAARQ